MVLPMRPQPILLEGVDGGTVCPQLLKDQGPAAIADQMLPKLLGDSTRRDRPEVLAAEVRALMLSNSTESIAGAIAALRSRPDSTALLASIHCPTLIVVGDEDASRRPRSARTCTAPSPAPSSSSCPGRAI